MPAPLRPRSQRLDPARVEALLINGGGTPACNYQSHLMRVRMLVDILRGTGVPAVNVALNWISAIQ